MLIYPLNEIFVSVQGEGYWTGTPAIFIRLQGCSIGCPWCDTKKSWNASEQYDITERLEKMLSVYPAVRHAVITGGEPCQFDLVPLITYLNTKMNMVQVETSGYFKPPKAKCWLTVSPKSFRQDYNLECVQTATELKIVVGSYADIQFAEKCRNENPNAHFYIQPMSEQKNAVDICMLYSVTNNWKLSARIHKYLDVK
jgi:7-carboxy-7-deazaguanine synthase